MLVIVLIILGGFYCLSILYQFKKGKEILKNYKVGGLLPNYSFFAPKPYTNDFRVIFKKNNSEDCTWEELDMYKSFSIKRLLWNPFKYYNKGMIDICQFLMRDYNILKDKEKIKVSSHHLNIVLSIYRYLQHQGEKVEHIKFAIVTSEGTKELKITGLLFNSNYQKI